MITLLRHENSRINAAAWEKAKVLTDNHQHMDVMIFSMQKMRERACHIATIMRNLTVGAAND